MDDEATNYDEKAKKSDGSCKYEASILWWYNDVTSNWLENTVNTSQIKIKVDNIVIATSDVTNFWSQAPSCGDAGSLTYGIEMVNIKQSTVSYYVQDDNKNSLWSGDVVLTPNDCIQIKLN